MSGKQGLSRPCNKGTHWQVYNDGQWNHNPAYVGNNEATARAVAAKIGGEAELLDFPHDGKEFIGVEL